MHVVQICKSVARWTLTIPISLHDFVCSFNRLTRNYYRKRNYEKFENIYRGVIWTCWCQRCLVRSNAADITVFCNSASIQLLETVR